MEQPLLVINNMYRIAFDRNMKEKSKSDEERQGEALSELSNSIEEGVI